MEQIDRNTPVRIHTLGPEGTNCQRAAYHWLQQNNIDADKAEVILHPTLEDGVKAVVEDENALLLGCIVYPQLHELVFNNLDQLYLKDCFVLPTFNMVLATKQCEDVEQIRTIVSHPAPVSLIRDLDRDVTLTTSNSKAASLVAASIFDACITTRKSAEMYGLKELKDFGEVPMGFSIHSVKPSTASNDPVGFVEDAEQVQVVNG